MSNRTRACVFKLNRPSGLRELAACKTLASKNETPCGRLSIVRFATGPKRSMGHLLGAEKEFFLNARPRAPYGLWRPRQWNPVNPWS